MVKGGITVIVKNTEKSSTYHIVGIINTFYPFQSVDVRKLSSLDNVGIYSFMPSILVLY